MGTYKLCKLCMHNFVCAYKEYYEEAVKLYEKARKECDKYPFFKCNIECSQYRKDSYFKQSIEGSIEDVKTDT